MKKWLLLSVLAIAGGVASWSCSASRSSGGAKQDVAVPEPQVAYTFFGVTADARGELFPCG